MRKTYSLEWREHGSWFTSVQTFKSPEKAKEHAEMIGASGRIRILPIGESAKCAGKTFTVAQFQAWVLGKRIADGNGDEPNDPRLKTLPN